MQSLNYYSRRGRGPASGDVSEDAVGGADRIIVEPGGRGEKKRKENAGIIVRRSPNYLAQFSRSVATVELQPNSAGEFSSLESVFFRESGSWKFRRLIERAVREDK